MSRTLNRSIARKQYAKFAKAWRDDLRRAGLYGRARSPKRPTFNQWYGMHQHNIEAMRESTPTDVAEYLRPDVDPWTEAPLNLSSGPDGAPEGERGVVTMDIVGNDD